MQHSHTFPGRLGPRWPDGRRDRLPAGRLWRVLGSSWLLGVLVAIASWDVVFLAPGPGLDASGSAALFMATHRGMDFGSQIVFPYGPLWFLHSPQLWYQGLAILGFLYSGAIYLLLATSLVWALRRTVPAVVAVVVAFFVLAAAPTMEMAVVLAVVWCLAALSPRAPALARPFVLFGGAVIGAIESLASPRSGPVILAMCAVTLLVGERRRRDLPIFIACAVAVLAVLWLAAGQGLGNIPDFVRGQYQVLSGFGQAMGVPASSGVYLPLIVVLSGVLVVLAALTSARGRARPAAAVVVALAAFVIYKEAVMRADAGHQAVFFATAAGIGAALCYGRWRLPAVVAVAGLVVLAVALPRPSYPALSFYPVTHARRAVDQARTLVDPARRRRLVHSGRAFLTALYRVPPSTLRLLRGHTVQVDPWEAAVAWRYGLDWRPLPTVQDYLGYTADLDRLNAAALRSPDGPQRILRENTRLVDLFKSAPAIDSRLPAWDPPAQSVAMLCNYVPLQTTARWQVLGKVPDRCGALQPIGTVQAATGGVIRLPPTRSGGVLIAKFQGAGVSGLERVRSLLYRARFRYAVVNGTAFYRLVPGTADDGLLMAAAPGADYPAPFALSPGARTIQITGTSGSLRVSLYRMRVRAERQVAAPGARRRRPGTGTLRP